MVLVTGFGGIDRTEEVVEIFRVLAAIPGALSAPAAFQAIKLLNRSSARFSDWLSWSSPATFLAENPSGFSRVSPDSAFSMECMPGHGRT
ncbi:MAG: hypothetical protein ACYCXP_09975 [Leptospirillum sp.]